MMKIRCITLALAALVSMTGTSAYAAFYVAADEVPFSGQVKSEDTYTKKSDTYEVPFTARRSQLSSATRDALQGHISEFREAAGILISGYGDNGKSSVATARASSIRTWLIRNGISRNNITIASFDDEALPTDDPKVFNSTITTTTWKKTSTATRLAGLPQNDGQDRLPPQLAEPIARPEPVRPAYVQPASNDSSFKVSLANKVIGLVRSGAIKADDAAVLLADLLSTADVAQQRLPSPVLPTQTAQFVPVVEASRAWQLVANKTLKDTLIEWAQTAGWQLTWESQNPYLVAYASTMNGTFIDVIGQVSNAIPQLEFQVWKGKRTIRITEGRM